LSRRVGIDAAAVAHAVRLASGGGRTRVRRDERLDDDIERVIDDLPEDPASDLALLRQVILRVESDPCDGRAVAPDGGGQDRRGSDSSSPAMILLTFGAERGSGSEASHVCTSDFASSGPMTRAPIVMIWA
jgi:hypothetical protein